MKRKLWYKKWKKERERGNPARFENTGYKAKKRKREEKKTPKEKLF